MPTPLTATHRLHIQYEQRGLQHSIRQYCATGGSGSDTVTDRSAGTITGPLTAQGFWDAVRAGLSSGANLVEVAMEELFSGAWLPIDFYSPTGAGQAGSGYEPAHELVATLRSTALHFMKFVFIEGNFPDAPLQHTTITQPGAHNMLGSATEWTPDHTVTNPPYNWAVSRDGHYVNDSGSVAGFTIAFNRRVRRRRNLT